MYRTPVWCTDNWPADKWPADNWPVDNCLVTFQNIDFNFICTKYNIHH